MPQDAPVGQEAPAADSTILSEHDFESGGVPQSEVVESSSEPTFAPADPGLSQAPPATPTAQETSAAWRGVIDSAREYGYDFGGQVPANDNAALYQLITNAREADRLRQQAQEQDRYTRLGQALAPHAERIMPLIQNPQAQPQQREPWQPPEFDQNWLALVQRDEQTGVFVSRPGVDPEVARKVNAFDQWQTKFQTNPAEFVSQAAEARANEVFERRIAEWSARNEQQSTARRIVNENAAWLYLTDATGNMVADPGTGQPALTPTGARYAQIMGELATNGISDLTYRDRVAKSILSAEISARNQQTQAVQSQVAPVQAAAARGAGPNVNPLQALSPIARQSTPGATTPSTEGQTFADVLRRRMAEAGVTDASLTPESFSGG
jgi:hypothetical protein